MPAAFITGGRQPISAQDAFRSLPNLADVPSGWSIRRFVFDLPPLVLAELNDEPADGGSGKRRYRIHAQDGALLGDHFGCITAELAARVRSRLLSTIAARPDQPAVYDRLAANLSSLERRFGLELLEHLFAESPTPILAALGYASDQEHRFAAMQDQAGLSLLIDGGLPWPIGFRDGGLARLEPGWSIAHIITCFSPLLLLELRHADGGNATWVLNEHCRRIDDDSFVDADVVKVLRKRAPGLIRRHWQQVVALEDTAPGFVPLAMLGLSPQAMLRVLHRVSDLVLPVTVDQILTTPVQPIVLSPTAAHPDGLVLRGDHVLRAVRHSLFQAGIEAVQRGGRMRWPSPLDGSDAELEAVFAPQEYTLVYQFRDRSGLRFMVATGDRDCIQLGLYLPDDDRFLCDRIAANAWFKVLIPAEFWMMLYEHCILHKEHLAGRSRGAGSEIVNVFMAPPLLHLGHYVWNDLSGQAELVRRLGAGAPRSMIIGAPQGQAELFGPIDVLFPEMAGRVDRHLHSKAAFTALIYATDIVPVRLTGSYVDRTLRDTVRSHVRDTGWACKAELERDRLGAKRVLVAGLRLEDRTFADPAAFFEQLIDHLHRRWPGTVLVMDGRNAQPGGAEGRFIASITDHYSIRSPLRLEHDLVERLQAHAGTRDVAVVSTVGLPVEASMAWCYLATACISPWGAGLAKYRWMANLPSLVLTSRHNLLHRPDLDIYHAPRWMEAPSTMVLPDPDRVTDRLDAHGNAPSPTAATGRECFDLDPSYVWSLLDPLLGAPTHPTTLPQFGPHD